MLAPLLALVATAWLVLLVATPLLPTSIATLTYSVGSFICHQLPERSFHVGDFQLPVCARCLGIYGGLTIGTLTCLALGSGPVDGSTQPIELARHRGLSPRAARWMILAAAFPTVTTVALEWLGMWRASNASRAAAGSVLGIGMAIVVMSALATLHYSSCVPRRPTVPSPPPPRT